MTGPRLPRPSAELRALGATFRRQCRGRRRHPYVVHAGVLGSPEVVLPRDPGQDPGLDSGLATDILERALREVDLDHAVAWVTRGGALAPSDADFTWFAASRQAWGRYGNHLAAFYVVTREGWLDLVSDDTGRWRARLPIA